MEKLACNLAIAKTLSTVGVSGSVDIWCDALQVPEGYYAEITSISMRWVGTPGGVEITSFLCDQSYSFNSSPLNSSGQLDTTKVGTAITAANETMPGSKNVMTTLFGSGTAAANGTPKIVLPTNWFLRFASQSGGSGGATNGSQFEIQIAYAFLPLCG